MLSRQLKETAATLSEWRDVSRENGRTRSKSRELTGVARARTPDVVRRWWRFMSAVDRRRPTATRNSPRSVPCWPHRRSSARAT